MKKLSLVLIALILVLPFASLSVCAAVPTAQAVKTNTPILIDGVVDSVWANAKVINVDTVDPLQMVAPIKGKVRVMWDAAHIYILAELPDPVLSASNPEWYMTDCFEFWIDEKNDKGDKGRELYNEDDVQFGVTYKGELKYPTSRNKYIAQQVKDKNITVASKIIKDASGNETGYNVEIMYTPTQASMSVNSQIGMAFQIDNDNGGGYREGMTYWAESTELFAYPKTWGTVTLIDAASGNKQSTASSGGTASNSNTQSAVSQQNQTNSQAGGQTASNTASAQDGKISVKSDAAQKAAVAGSEIKVLKDTTIDLLNSYLNLSADSSLKYFGKDGAELTDTSVKLENDMMVKLYTGETEISSYKISVKSDAGAITSEIVEVIEDDTEDDGDNTMMIAIIITAIILVAGIAVICIFAFKKKPEAK